VVRLQKEGIRERERSVGEGSGDIERGRDGKDMVVKTGKGVAIATLINCVNHHVLGPSTNSHVVGAVV